MFLKISKYAQENTCVGVSFQHSCFPVTIAKLLRTTYRTPLVANLENFAVVSHILSILSSCYNEASECEWRSVNNYIYKYKYKQNI